MLYVYRIVKKQQLDQLIEEISAKDSTKTPSLSYDAPLCLSGGWEMILEMLHLGFSWFYTLF